MNILSTLATLRGRLTFILIMLVLSACALVAGIALSVVEQEGRANIGAQQFSLLSAAAEHLAADIDNKQILLRMVAENMAGADKLDGARMQAMLERHDALRTEFDSVIVLDRTGRMSAGVLKKGTLSFGGQRFDDRHYFKATLAQRKSIVSEPVISKVSGKPLILITAPVLGAGGEVLYILGGSIRLDDSSFFAKIRTLNPGESGYLFALTPDGMILHHPNTARLLRNVRSEAGAPVPSTLKALGGWEGWTLGSSKNGTRAVLTYKRMRGTGWILGSVYPSAEAFRGIHIARETAWVDAAVVALLVGLAGWYLLRLVLNPLHLLRQAVEEVELGQRDIDAFDLKRSDEIGALSRAFHSLSLKRRAAEAQLARMALTDALTGLRNRRSLDEALGAAYERVKRTRGTLSVAFLDIDHFKRINDTWGHEAGDLVLQEFARRLLKAVRATDAVFRLAGDEFVIIFEFADPAHGLDVAAAKVVQAMQAPFEIGGQTLSATTSMGVAAAHWSEADPKGIMLAADEALYEAKRAGRNRYHLAGVHYPAAVPAAGR
ncbi:sensor domain-containing diguanylate cyclase [Massilia sp. DD77]|uniref:sensor domain-containing diguanylate cyclase n=1 Tax=Massilia sp. DD77 TaxID=3109349 RepID=UPI00300013C6